MSLRTPLAVFCFSALAYLLTAAGVVDTTDAQPSIAMATALVEGKGFCVERYEDAYSYYYTTEQCGFSKMGLIHPLLYVPPVVIGKMFARAGGDIKMWTDFFVSLVNPVLTALLLLVTFLYFFERPEMTLGNAVFLTIAAGFATHLWSYLDLSSQRNTRRLE